MGMPTIYKLGVVKHHPHVVSFYFRVEIEIVRTPSWDTHDIVSESPSQDPKDVWEAHSL